MGNRENFSIFEEILKTDNVWNIDYRDYNTATGLRAFAYNLMVISNIDSREKPNEIERIVSY